MLTRQHGANALLVCLRSLSLRKFPAGVVGLLVEEKAKREGSVAAACQSWTCEERSLNPILPPPAASDSPDWPLRNGTRLRRHPQADWKRVSQLYSSSQKGSKLKRGGHGNKERRPRAEIASTAKPTAKPTATATKKNNNAMASPNPSSPNPSSPCITHKSIMSEYDIQDVVGKGQYGVCRKGTRR